VLITRRVFEGKYAYFVHDPAAIFVGTETTVVLVRVDVVDVVDVDVVVNPGTAWTQYAPPSWMFVQAALI